MKTNEFRFALLALQCEWTSEEKFWSYVRTTAPQLLREQKLEWGEMVYHAAEYHGFKLPNEGHNDDDTIDQTSE